MQPFTIIAQSNGKTSAPGEITSSPLSFLPAVAFLIHLTSHCYCSVFCFELSIFIIIMDELWLVVNYVTMFHSNIFMYLIRSSCVFVYLI